MSEKLSKVGIEPIIAVKERAYGEDIFCTKICGKIIESRFCIVILDDSVEDGTSIPNPNVYYEYGLMTALRKHIVPLQKENLKLAFNIQSYDTIKYNPGNITAELDRAIRDAIKLTEAKEPERDSEAITDKFILRRMELAGFDAKDENWFLSEVIEDTAFKGFGHRENSFYAYIGKIDNVEDIQIYIDDLRVVIYRTEKKAKDLQEKIRNLNEEREQIVKEISPLIQKMAIVGHFAEYIYSEKQQDPRLQKIKDLDKRINEQLDLLKLMTTIFLAFIVNTEIDLSEFLKTADSMLESYSRYKITCSRNCRIEFGDVFIDFEISRH
jgi:hypothetical protein